MSELPPGWSVSWGHEDVREGDPPSDAWWFPVAANGEPLEVTYETRAGAVEGAWRAFGVPRFKWMEMAGIEEEVGEIAGPREKSYDWALSVGRDAVALGFPRGPRTELIIIEEVEYPNGNTVVVRPQEALPDFRDVQTELACIPWVEKVAVGVNAGLCEIQLEVIWWQSGVEILVRSCTDASVLEKEGSWCLAEAAVTMVRRMKT